MRTTRRVAQKLVVTCMLLVFCNWASGQKDPGVRGGLRNTGGALRQQGIPIPHPPLISPNPTTGVPLNANELASFLEGILPPAGLSPLATTAPMLLMVHRSLIWVNSTQCSPRAAVSCSANG
jgi:hypothetical protein